MQWDASLSYNKTYLIEIQTKRLGVFSKQIIFNKDTIQNLTFAL